MKAREFENIFKKSGRKIYNYLLRLTGNADDAADVMQEIFSGFYQKMDSVQPGAQEGYLFRSAYNRAINLIKLKKRWQPLEDRDNLVQSEPEPDRQAINLQSKRNKAIALALAKLNANERQAIELQFYQKLSYSKIAETMDLSVSAVDSLLVRAKRKLKKNISQELEPAGVLTKDMGEEK